MTPAHGEELTFVDLRVTRDEELLSRVFNGLYVASFPRDEERESLPDLRDALWGNDQALTTHFVVARRGPDSAVEGLVACEYYPRSRCGLISYLAVEPEARGRGLGRSLTEQAIETLRRDAAAEGSKLAAVFAEVHDPMQVGADDDVIGPVDRLRIMSQLGAKRVPIAYVQPSLGPGRPRVRSLLLVAFPLDASTLDSIPGSVVRGFLQEFYAVLGVEGHDADLDRALGALAEDEVELDELLVLEEPHLSFSEFGIAFHFVAPLDSGGTGSEAEIASFEEDMLAYAYVRERPFSTHVIQVPSELARVSVRFSSDVAFVSEGRSVLLVSADGSEGRVRDFVVRASRTDFEQGGFSVLHLVLGPDPAGTTLDEYDILKLAKLWIGGEGLQPGGLDARGAPYVTFVAGGSEQTVGALASAVFGQELREDRPRVGTIQLLHPICRHGLCQEMLDVRKGEGAASPSPELIAVGGLIQGLFDFAEIDADELADVFKEVELEEELVSCFHKGTLLVASAADRAFSAREVRRSIGLSPYLLVPHAVLAHNERCLEDAIDRLHAAEDDGRWRLRELGAARADAARTLSVRLVPNVFHYAEERQLYLRGTKHRALDEHQRTAQQRLGAVEADIAARHNVIRSAVGGLVPLLALVFTWLDALSKYDHTVVLAVLVPTTVLTVAALAFVFWRD